MKKSGERRWKRRSKLLLLLLMLLWRFGRLRDGSGSASSSASSSSSSSSWRMSCRRRWRAKGWVVESLKRRSCSIQGPDACTTQGTVSRRVGETAQTRLSAAYAITAYTGTYRPMLQGRQADGFRACCLDRAFQLTNVLREKC